MAQMIDNVFVGNFIKSLLKEKHMTQDQLADMLHITKAAVSQNLNGKSTFDIENLLKIAEYFNLKLDDLIAGRRPVDMVDVDSEALRMIKRGLAHFQQHDPQQLYLVQPDIYGKLLIDYLLDGAHHDWIRYLVEQRIRFVEVGYHRHQSLLQHLMLYVMQHGITSPLPLIEQLIQVYGELTFTQPLHMDTFLHLLEKDTTDLAKTIFTKQSVFRKKRYLFGLAIPSQYNLYWINRLAFIDQVITLKLVRLWELAITHYLESLSFFVYERYFSKLVKADFAEGLTIWIKRMKPLSSFEVFESKPLFEACAYGLSQNLPKVVDMVVAKHMISDMNAFVAFLLKTPHHDYVSHLIHQHAAQLKAKRVVKDVLGVKAETLLEQHPQFFNEDVLSYGMEALPLAMADKALLTTLIRLGATFKPEYYNAWTSEKMNRLVSKTKKGN